MREIRITVAAIFIVAGICIIAKAEPPEVHEMVQGGLTFFCTGIILFFCDKNSRH